MARSTSGEVAGLSSQLGRVRIPHESLTWACRRVGALTCNQGDRVQLPAGPLTKQLSGVKCNGWHRSFGAIESGSIPTHPTEEMVVEGWSPYPSDKRIALSSILRATTEQQT